MTLRIAVPNKGRLDEPATEVLRQSGMRFERTPRTLSVPVSNLDIELLFVRTEDIPELVSDGIVGLGITGLDLIEEAGLPLETVLPLGFGHCSLAAAVPLGSEIGAVEDFTGCRIATSHPQTTNRFFAGKGVEITTVPLRGSVEVAPRLDVADAVVDLVSSGSTLRVNGLRQVVTILESQAYLIRDPKLSDGLLPLANQVRTMVAAVATARSNRYLMMNAPEAAVETISRLIPGLAAPTVVPLAGAGMVAVHSVVAADDLWRVLPALEQAGAGGILVLPIEALIP